MEAAGLSPVLTGVGLGLALASAPGPVQAVLFAEAVNGGLGRGLRAMFAAALTFAVLLVAVALGLSIAQPTGVALRVLEVGGGAFLLWLAVDAFRSARESTDAPAQRGGLPAPARGALAVILNPAAWLFMAVVAAPLFAVAAQRGGSGNAVLTALALAVGVGIGDASVVLVGGLGVRRAGVGVQRWVRRGLALILAALALWLMLQGIAGTT